MAENGLVNSDIYRCTDCDEFLVGQAELDDHLMNYHFTPSDYVEEVHPDDAPSEAFR